jgi:lactoylglutathione lyase
MHFGMWVDDLEVATKKVPDTGATYFWRPDNNSNTFYEVEYKTLDGVIFDLTHNGWRGALGK